MNNNLKGHFLNLYMMALSDQNFDEKELDTILQIGKERGISESEFEDIILNPTTVEHEYPNDFVEKIELLYDFTRVIWADQDLKDDEKDSFLKFCKNFGFGNEESEELLEWLLELAKQDTPSDQLEYEINKLTN